MKLPVRSIVTLAGAAILSSTPHTAAADAQIRVNQIGFLTDDGKQALLMATTPGSGAIFQVFGADGGVVSTGSVGNKIGSWNEACAKIYFLDFFSVKRAGSYSINVSETIDARNVAALARNDTKKLRLINVWATWCASCVQEFPELVSLPHRFANRDFEVITISVDDPKDEAKVKQFLDRQHATVPNRVQRSVNAGGRDTNNYLYSGAGLDALMRALDPNAPGPVPYTILVAPGGKIIYRSAGQIDAAGLQAKIVDLLGPYYSYPGK